MEVNNFDNLVKSITSNIIDKMDYKTEFSLNDKSCLILIPNIVLGFNDYYDYIIKTYPGYDIYIGTSEEFMETHIIEKNNIQYVNLNVRNSEFIKILDAVNTIVILGLKISQMKSLIDTDDLDDVNHLILESIMVNKSVNIMLNTNGLIFNKILKVVKDLRILGINVVNIQQNMLSKNDDNKLITESYVLNLRDNGLESLVLNKKQIITPLAKDKLREFRMKIEYHKEEN